MWTLTRFHLLIFDQVSYTIAPMKNKISPEPQYDLSCKFLVRFQTRSHQLKTRSRLNLNMVSRSTGALSNFKLVLIFFHKRTHERKTRSHLNLNTISPANFRSSFKHNLTSEKHNLASEKHDIISEKHDLTSEKHDLTLISTTTWSDPQIYD